MLKKMLPVGLGLILVALITLTVTLVKNGNNKTPSFSGADDTYLTLGDLKVTNEKLYTYMKKTYGVTELLNMVDEQLYAEDIKKVDTSSDAYMKYVYQQVFKVDDLKDAEEPQKTWDDIISSLRASELISKEDAKDNAYDKFDSKVWTVVKDYYKLGYARTEWAKKAYLDKYYADRNDGKWFDMTKAENSTGSIEAYYDANYKGSVTGFYIPFTSEKAAYETMKKFGINTHQTVLAQDGWVKDSYDYNTDSVIDPDQYLSYNEVIEAFFNMYNSVLSYYNNGTPIINSDSYTMVLKETQTAYLVESAILKQIEKKALGNKVILPTTASIKDQDDATITWKLEEDKFGTLENNVLTGKFSDKDKYSVENKLSYTIKFKDKEIAGDVKVELTMPKANADGTTPEPTTTTVTLTEIDAFKAYEFTEDFISNPGNDWSKFNWTLEDTNEVNSALTTYLSTDSTKLTVSENPDKLYKSYTLKPVKIGNYYFLIIKLQDNPAEELFEKDEDGKIVKDDNGDYVIKNQDLLNEIIEKKKEELLSDNAINQMVYKNRFDHNVKIFDSYLEAMYEYEYTNFFTTTLKTTDYDVYKASKKNQKETILSYYATAGDKKSIVKINAIDLFNRLEKKYGMNISTTLIENYNLITNKDLNNIFNPFTNEVYNETSYKNLLNSEINSLRKNFESGYFTYSYLSYYGFTPNFPAKYGWTKFIHDYFTAYSDQELLTNSSYGGSIYTDALQKYTDSLYDYSDILEEMTEAYNDWYGVNVVNLMVKIDYNYNADDANKDAAKILLEEVDNWTDNQKALAKELSQFVYDVANQTNKTSIYEQLNAVVTLYSEAGYEYDATEWQTNKDANTSIYDYNYFGKYKKEGLVLSVEKAADYDSSSSIYEEFADECRVLWNRAKDLNLLGTTFDVPLISDEAFTTDYGYHMIAVLSAKKPTDLPSEEEIEIYRAQALIDAINKNIEEVKKNIETYKASGYNITSYESQLDVYNAKLDSYKAALAKVLEKYGKESDYTLDTEATGRINAWYTNAEKAIEEGTIVTESYIKTMREQLGSINFNNGSNKDRFNAFLDLLQDEVDRQNEEE